ncbi:hypothetical protein DQG13_22575 [Paenibacillus sp. YN15]|nr:hypothetical protein DQG13_22575 [Paenibacillus sp. YN15]
MVQYGASLLKVTDSDAFFAFLHKAPQAVPQREGSQHGRFRALGVDEQAVVKGIFVDGSSKVQIVSPSFPAAGQVGYFLFI